MRVRKKNTYICPHCRDKPKDSTALWLDTAAQPIWLVSLVQTVAVSFIGWKSHNFRTVLYLGHPFKVIPSEFRNIDQYSEN